MTPTMPMSSRGLLDRAVKAAMLDRATYEEVEADEGATTQAAIVVVAGALASGLGQGFAQGNAGGVVFGIVFALVGWLAYAAAAYLVGTKLLAGPETKARSFLEVARPLGFAAAPQVLLIAGIVPLLGFVVAIVVLVWVLVATVVAVRAALDVTTGRAVAIAIVSAFALFVVQLVLAGLFVRPAI